MTECVSGRGGREVTLLNEEDEALTLPNNDVLEENPSGIGGTIDEDTTLLNIGTPPDGAVSTDFCCPSTLLILDKNSTTSFLKLSLAQSIGVFLF